MKMRTFLHHILVIVVSPIIAALGDGIANEIDYVPFYLVGIIRDVPTVIVVGAICIVPCLIYFGPLSLLYHWLFNTFGRKSQTNRIAIAFSFLVTYPMAGLLIANHGHLVVSYAIWGTTGAALTIAPLMYFVWSHDFKDGTL
jgi:hypothetical protein